jgi:hypothetical protein
MTKLRECPLCDCEVSFHEAEGECDGCHHIHCKACGALFDFAFDLPTDAAETMDELRELCAAKWNHRFDDPTYDDCAPLFDKEDEPIPYTVTDAGRKAVGGGA